MALSVPTWAAGQKILASQLQQLSDGVTALSSYVRKTADESVTSSTTLQDDDALFFTAAANATYEIECFFKYSGAAVASVFKIGWSGPSGATFDWVPMGLVDTDTANTADHVWMKYCAIGDTNNFGGSGSTNVVARPSGLLITSSTSGTFKLQWAQGTSSGTACTLKAGSYIRYSRIA